MPRLSAKNQRRYDLRYEDLPSHLQGFVDRQASTDRQLMHATNNANVVHVKPQVISLFVRFQSLDRFKQATRDFPERSGQ